MRFFHYSFFLLANLIIANDRGIELFNSGNYKEAAEYYSSILKEKGEDNAASFSLGASEYYMDDHLSALRRFEQVLSSEDRTLQSKALYNMARILQDQNELDESLSLYRKSLELNPNDIDSKINYELLKKIINQEGSEDQQNDQNQEGSEDQQNSSKSQIEDALESEKSDKIRQAETILNAIKGQEKINQKHKILKSKSFKLDKDW